MSTPPKLQGESTAFQFPVPSRECPLPARSLVRVSRHTQGNGQCIWELGVLWLRSRGQWMLRSYRSIATDFDSAILEKYLESKGVFSSADSGAPQPYSKLLSSHNGLNGFWARTFGPSPINKFYIKGMYGTIYRTSVISLIMKCFPSCPIECFQSFKI